MAFTTCAGQIAANITKDCEKPNVAGYTGRGVLIPVEYLGNVTVDADNKHIISDIQIKSGKNVCAVDNVWTDAFNGSSTQSTNDNGRATFTKTFAFRIPMRGAAVSQNIVEPLLDSPLGFIAVLEKKFRGGDGSFEIVGYQNSLRADADGIVRNEYENGGDITAQMSCTEPYFEIVLLNNNYETTLADFETLLDRAF